jgi:hypothetical protein
MDSIKRKPLAELHKAIKKRRERRPDPKVVEKYNEMIRKDEEADKRQQDRKIAQGENEAAF